MPDKSFIENIEKMDFTLPETKTVVLGVIEMLYATVVELKEKVQTLEDEINRLKGEKGKPDIKPNKNINTKPKMEKGDTSKKWIKKAKIVKVDRTEIIPVDKTILPNDAVFKGYSDKVIQNIIITTDNVLYRREIFYSESENTTYTATLPSSLKNTSFAPEIKAQILKLYFECRMTENLIHSFLTSIGISISEGQISNIIIKEKADNFTEEKNDIFITGVECSENIGIDDSGHRENGKNKYNNIICGIFFTVFFVKDNKKGATIEKIFEFLDLAGKTLSCDDAKQFKILKIIIQLCWVHEERHYKKLNPILKSHREELERKTEEIWGFYNELKDYKKYPNIAYKEILENLFEDIFNCSVSYPALNERLKLTYAKKDSLLAVLNNPSAAIHNNMSENGIRAGVIKRKISNGTRTSEGTIAWENHLSILSTCKKNGISYYEYILEVFEGKEHIKSLSDLIKEKTTVVPVV
jgi:hypothetical protein